MIESQRRRGGSGASHRIEEVARRAGVAPITVSRVLNKPETVSDKTKAVVWAAIEEIGYVPNRLAGGLASNKSRNVGLVLPFIDNPAFAERVKGVSDVLSAAGYTMLFGLSAYSPEAELNQVTTFLGQRAAGLILTGTQHHERTYKLLATAGIPVVEVPLITGPLIDMAVGYSAEQASHAMVTHLARCGYRKIGLVSATLANNPLARERHAGYLRAVAELGLAEDPGLIVEAHPSVVNGGKAFVELLARHPDMHAVYCMTDFMAMGAILEARRRGIDVPGDIGIAGYDDIELAQEFIPPLTTVRVRRYEVGERAARMLLEHLEGNPPSRKVVDLGFEIVPRQSTARPKT